ncbi:MAG: hypothetical protein RL328_274 [Acidobacteriota bacterium]
MRFVLLSLLTVGALSAQLKEYKPSRLNLFSKDQDVQLGKESADEVRKTMPIVNNKDLVAYMNRIGQKLAASKRAGGFPYTFEIINDPSINAFALPGGPMFVHTGLIASVENESQLAGVLAHEMSHVSLRHGTSNVSKANLIQLPAMLAGQALGTKGGMLGTLGQLGVTLGAGSVLLRFSRDAEKEADLNGAQMMNDAGYDPTAMAIFFDKLNEGGKRDDGKLANFLSDHPTPGRRTTYVAEQNKYLPKVKYAELDPQALARAKQEVAKLPPPPKPVAAAAPAGGGTAPGAQTRPSGQYKQHAGSSYRFNYPSNWDVLGDPNAASVTVAPKATIVQDAQGNVQVGYGFMTAYFVPQDQKPNLQRDTAALLQQMKGANPGMTQTGNARGVKVAGQDALLTPFESGSPYAGQKETDMILTIARPEGLFYTVFIAPQAEWAGAQPAFDAVVSSLQFVK